MTQNERASKKQRELLSFVDSFIKGNGYGPSYREIMRALGYKSVSTVAVHIDGLINKGFLIKRTHSARSLEVVTTDISSAPAVKENREHLLWLESEVDEHLKRQELSPETAKTEDIRTLIESLRILGANEAYHTTRQRFEKLL